MSTTRMLMRRLQRPKSMVILLMTMMLQVKQMNLVK